MQVGDRVIERPMHANQLVSMKRGCEETREEAEGRIVYIHPDKRFYTVEFQTRGGPVRESFIGKPCAVDCAREPKAGRRRKSTWEKWADDARGQV